MCIRDRSCAEIERKGNNRLLQAAISTSRGRVVPRGSCAEKGRACAMFQLKYGVCELHIYDAVVDA